MFTNSLSALYAVTVRSPTRQGIKSLSLWATCRVELFAREKADGWDAWGNEVDCDIEIEGYRERTGGDFVVG